MVRMQYFVIGILVLQIFVNAAPSDVSKIEDIAKIEEGPRLDSGTGSLEEEIKGDINSLQGQRQKRFYNFYGYGYPPVNPLPYPSYNKRDQSADTGVYGSEDPLALIHRRLQEIANAIRQPAPPLPPQPPTQFPFFFPIIYYIPQQGCACNPETNTTPKTPTAVNNQTIPGIFTRFPLMNDARQNWGFVTNGQDDTDDNDYSRPISFDPIVSDTPLSKPPPPVEHGSSQAETQGNSQTTTTVRPNVPNDIGQSTSYPSFDVGTSRPNEGPPSACDKAILSCCHQLQVTYGCFEQQGCPSPIPYGNPCDPKVILGVIDRYQKFYGQRNG